MEAKDDFTSSRCGNRPAPTSKWAVPAVRWAAARAASCPSTRAAATARRPSAAPRRRAKAGSPRRGPRAASGAASGTSRRPCPRPATLDGYVWGVACTTGGGKNTVFRSRLTEGAMRPPHHVHERRMHVKRALGLPVKLRLMFNNAADGVINATRY